MYNRVQLKRLVKIVELLRSGKYPNSRRIVAALAESANDDLNELDDLRCSEKTAKRDIKLLKEEFHCPLVFDRERNGFCLTDRDWDFFYPAILDETEILAMFLGLRLAEQDHARPAEKRNPARGGLPAEHEQPGVPRPVVCAAAEPALDAHGGDLSGDLHAGVSGMEAAPPAENCLPRP